MFELGSTEGDMAAWLWPWPPAWRGWALLPGSAGSGPWRGAWRPPVTAKAQSAELTVFRDKTGHRSKFQMEVQHLSL